MCDLLQLVEDKRLGAAVPEVTIEGAAPVDDSLGLEEALVIKPLVVALGDYSERVVEEGKQMLGLNDQGFPNLEVLRDVVVSLSPPSLHHPANADSRVPATVLQ